MLNLLANFNSYFSFCIEMCKLKMFIDCIHALEDITNQNRFTKSSFEKLESSPIEPIHF